MSSRKTASSSKGLESQITWHIHRRDQLEEFLLRANDSCSEQPPTKRACVSSCSSSDSETSPSDTDSVGFETELDLEDLFKNSTRKADSDVACGWLGAEASQSSSMTLWNEAICEGDAVTQPAFWVPSFDQTADSKLDFEEIDCTLPLNDCDLRPFNLCTPLEDETSAAWGSCLAL